MENNKQNLITKIVTYSIVFLGILFTVWVMNDDNPAEMSYEQQKQWAIAVSYTHLTLPTRDEV